MIRGKIAVMNTVLHLHDLVDQTDPEKRTFKQINAAKIHNIPVGSLVEVEPTEPYKYGARLYVAYHGRDCDQAPLYWLSARSDDTEKLSERFMNPSWRGGISESYLTVIESPPQPG